MTSDSNTEQTMKNSGDKPKKDSNPAKNVLQKASNLVPKVPKLGKIDLSSKARGSFEKASQFVTKSPRIAQLVLGGTSGWCTGFLTTRVGKTVAIPVGGSILILGAASSMGITNINWERFGQWGSYYACRAQEKMPAIKANIMKNGKVQPMFLTGFVGGFLLGLAS